MSSRVQEANLPFATFTTEIANTVSADACKEIFEANRHRIYSLAFWMTDNEMTAEEISTRVFCKSFAGSGNPDTNQIDNNLLHELREIMPIGLVTLHINSLSSQPVRGNIKRIHMERAVVQIPGTERLAFLLHDVEGYSHTAVSRLLGLSEAESKEAVYQARLLMRELIAGMR